MYDQSKPKHSLGARLLREEAPNESEYEEYRMNLELALNRAKRLEKITVHICWISFLTAMALMFVGGSRVVGSFDPFSKDANPLSIALGVIYVLAMIAWPLSLAAGFSRFRPRIFRLRRDISDAKIDELQREVESLRDRLGE